MAEFVGVVEVVVVLVGAGLDLQPPNRRDQDDMEDVCESAGACNGACNGGQGRRMGGGVRWYGESNQ